MTMIRNTMLGLSFLALTATSAFAAPRVTHHTTTRVVAQAPAADTAPATDKAAKPAKEKKAKKSKKDAAPKAEMKSATPEAK
jgi:hypothetical protein